jgi:DNA-binding FadR family transcriptional regulator
MQILRALSMAAHLPIQNRVARALVSALTLRIFPNTRMPSERALADLLSVSRPTVRQALNSLRKAGLTSSGPYSRSGTKTSPLARQRKTYLLKNFRREIHDILEFRIALETAAVRIATRAADSNFINRLRLSIEENARSTRPSEFRRTDTVFHLAIAQQTKNFQLIAAIANARAEFLMYRDLHPMPDNVASNVSEHKQILTSIEAGDPEAAADAMNAHLQNSLHSFVWSVANLDSGKRNKVRNSPRATQNKNQTRKSLNSTTRKGKTTRKN